MYDIKALYEAGSVEEAIRLLLEHPPAQIIAGGSEVSALTHVARTVCRRAERCCVRLNQQQPIDEQLLKYINRLSDYLFVLSRFFLKLENKTEIYWQSPK